MNKKLWLIALLIALFFILIKGYTFNSGDQEEHLPQVYQLINPALYPLDYFVKASNENFTVRYFFVRLIYFLHFIMSVSAACFLLHIASLTIVAWSIQQIALHFGATKTSSSIAAFMSLVVFNSFTLGGNSLMDNQLNCGNLATALCSLAFYYAINKRLLHAGLLAALATLFQVLIGLQVMLLLSLLYIGINKKEWNKVTLFKALTIYFLFSAAMLIPILQAQFGEISSEQSLLFYDILFLIRNPNHYLPSSFPLVDYLRFFSLTVIAAAFHFFVDKHLKHLWRIMFLVIIGGMFLYTFLLEGLEILSIGKSQWFKVSVWMQLMDALVIMAFVSTFISDKLISFLKSDPKAIRFLQNVTGNQYSISVIILLLFLLITNSQSIPFERINQRYQIGNYPNSALSRMHDWISKNTPIDCVILTSPTNTSFLCEAKRSMPIGWKAIIHEPYFMIPWYAKFKTVYNNGADFKGFNVLEQASLHYNEFPPLPDINLNWDFRLMDITVGKINITNEKEVYRVDNFVLLKTIK